MAPDVAALLNEDEDVVGWCLSARWPKEVNCHRCGHREPRVGAKFVLIFRASDGSCIWKCPRCHRQFSLTSGTAFNNHRLSYGQLLAFLYVLISEPERPLASVAREIGVSYKTAWALRNRIVNWLGAARFVRLREIADIEGAMTEAIGVLLTPKERPE